MKRRYGSDYRDVLALATERWVGLRPITVQDREALAEGFKTLSRRSVRERFFHFKRELSPQDLDRLTQLDGENHFALVAIGMRERRAAIIGVGRFARVAGEQHCAEVALTVADDWQGLGLGHALLVRLAEAAVERGFQEFRYTLLADNDTMRQLLVEYAAEFKDDGQVLLARTPLERLLAAEPERLAAITHHAERIPASDLGLVSTSAPDSPPPSKPS